MENTMEMPECPVCLQAYDEEETIPRVLPCGHSACSPCLVLLSASSSARSFADTIRCPACNQVVPYPRGQGPSALPKNIDLLRLCSPSSSSRRDVHSRPPEPRGVEFLALPWNDPFWISWKDRIIPADIISVTEPVVKGTGTVSATLRRAYSSDRNWSFRENQTVRLLPVGAYWSSSPSSSMESGSAEFKLSYKARVMEALSKLTEEERTELGLIAAAPLRQRRDLCRVLGLWMNLEENSPLFMVSEAFNFGLSVSLNGNEETKVANPDDFFELAKVSLELCEAMMGLHSQGIACGCLTPSCFRYDSYGHFSIDLSEVLLACKRVRMDMAEATSRSNQCFVSPEIRKELFSNKPDPKCKSGAIYGSDVWSLACILLLLLKGDENHCALWDDSYELNSDLYETWVKMLTSTLRSSLQGTRLETLLPILISCLHYDPECRPGMHEVWTSLRSLSFRSTYNVPAGPETLAAEKLLCCLVFADLCRVPEHESKTKEDVEQDADHFREEKANLPQGKSLNGGGLQSVSLQGHQDCVSGLAEGGGFLFSCSFDKTVRVWSLQDFSHVRTLRGAEQRLSAVVAVDIAGRPPLCIAGDGGGGLYAWDISTSAAEDIPRKKWRHHSDWRYSGVGSMAASQHYCYSGGGDRAIKAWSLQDLSLACTLEGHRSAVSCLAVSEGILYSGSWDGTIRLWWLHDHTPMAEIQDQGATLPKGASVLSLSVDGPLLAASYDAGVLQVWRDGTLQLSAQVLEEAIFAVVVDGKWVFAGGWDRTVLVQELFSENESGESELRPVGSIVSDSVVTALLHRQGMLYVCSNKEIKVYHCEGELQANECA